MPAQMCPPHPAHPGALKKIPGSSSRILWMSREEEPGEGADRLFGIESQTRDLQLKETPEEQMGPLEVPVPAAHRQVGVMLLWL